MAIITPSIGWGGASPFVLSLKDHSPPPKLRATLREKAHITPPLRFTLKRRLSSIPVVP